MLFLPRSARGRLEAAAVAGAVFLFAALTAAYFWSPGRIQDTLYNEWFATELAEHLAAGRLRRFFAAGCPLYHGRISAYLMSPFVVFLGPNWTFVRLWPIVFGVLTLGVGYFFVRDLFGRRAAMLALFLLAIHPAYVMGTKVGNHQVSCMGFFSLGALVGAFRWHRTGRRAALCAGLFLLGMGLGTRLWFGWFAAAFFVSAAPVVWKRWKDVPEARGRLWRDLTWGGTFFLLGGALVFGTELAWDFASFRLVFRRMWAADPFGSPVRPGFSPALWFRSFNALLSGDYYFRYIFDAASPRLFKGLYVWLTGAGAAACLAMRAGRDERERGRFSWILSLFLVTALLALLSTALWPFEQSDKLFILYPFPQIFISLAGAWLWDRSKAGGRAVCLGALLILVSWEGWGLSAYFRQMARTGGRGRASDGIYDLARWLRGHARSGEPVLFLDADALLNSRFILAGSGVRFLDFTYLAQDWELPDSDVEFRRKLDAALAAPPSSRLYVVNDLLSAWTLHERRFKTLAGWTRSRGLRSGLETTVREADGRPLYEVHSVEKKDFRGP